MQPRYRPRTFFERPDTEINNFSTCSVDNSLLRHFHPRWEAGFSFPSHFHLSLLLGSIHFTPLPEHSGRIAVVLDGSSSICHIIRWRHCTVSTPAPYAPPTCHALPRTRCDLTLDRGVAWTRGNRSRMAQHFPSASKPPSSNCSNLRKRPGLLCQFYMGNKLLTSFPY